MSTIHKIRVIFPRRTKIQLIFLLLGITVGALLETITLSIISPFISILLDSAIITRNSILSFIYDIFNFKSTSDFLSFIAIIVASAYIFRGAYMFLLSKIQYKFLSIQQIRLSDKLLAIVLSKPYTFHINHNIADLTRVVLGDTHALFAMILAVLALLSDLFMSLFMLIYLFIVSPSITMVMLFLSLVCIFIYFYFFRNRIRDVGIIYRNKNIAMSKAVMQALGGIKELKVLRREGFFINAFKQSGNEYVHANQKFQVYNSLPRLFIESFCFGGAFLIIGIFIKFGADLAGLVPQISVFVLAAFRILPAISRLATNVNTIIFNKASTDSIYDYISGKRDAVVPASTVYANIEKSQDVVIQNVTFQYPGGSEPVLENISFKIPNLRSVALVGASGAGKTTLVDIILGIYKPAGGTVYYDGYDIHQNPDKWVQNVGYIPQQIYLLDDTITNNIAFGIPPKEIDHEQVWYALEQAQLKDFVISLPDGLDTIVGDRGVRLSGGQRQRIGIARALYYNPSILILDEATSSLDNETEAAVMDAINSFQGTKTMVIIAHRLSTIEHCDFIYRIQDGKAALEKPSDS